MNQPGLRRKSGLNSETACDYNSGASQAGSGNCDRIHGSGRRYYYGRAAGASCGTYPDWFGDIGYRIHLGQKLIDLVKERIERLRKRN
jgi:hypothetical protein